MFDSSGGDVMIQELERPKMDWYGTGFRWNCVPCGTTSTTWFGTRAAAVKAGEQHAKVKHSGGKPEWQN